MSDHRSFPSRSSIALAALLPAALGLAPRAGAPAADPPAAAVTAEPGAAADLPVQDGRPLTPAERLRVTLLGGNPIFALDWLAPGLELQGGRPAPPRPRVPLP